MDCAAVVEGLLRTLDPAIRESGATVSQDDPPTVGGDRSQMTQVFQNLMGNAIKFRSQEPPVIALQAENTGAELLFSIRDNGIGIAPEHADRIFEVFHRLHSRIEYPGNGIGLAICKKIVERNGGTIWIETREGGGAIFKFTWPQLSS